MTAPGALLEQAQVIQLVIDAHNRAVGSSYIVTCHPDLENRGSPDIDAHAEAEGLRPLAIEHTKLQSLAEQTRDSAWFVRALGPLETELASVFPFQLDLVVPYNNVETGSDWATIRERIKTWLLANATALPLGRTTCKVQGVPFPLALRKWTTGEQRVFLMRETPPGDRDALLLLEMQKALDHKYAKLGEYRTRGATSVLVLESEDIALVSPQDLYRAFLLATRERPRSDLDQIWLVHLGSVYCFSGPTAVMTRVNPENFRFGPQFIDEWLPRPPGKHDG